MKWQEDPLKYEKYLVFDAIIEFYQQQKGNDLSQITLDMIIKFTDDFFSRKNPLLS